MTKRQQSNSNSPLSRSGQGVRPGSKSKTAKFKRGDCVVHQFRVTNPVAPVACIVKKVDGDQAYIVALNSGLWVDLDELTPVSPMSDHLIIRITHGL